jgi:hypothetical protein
VRGVRHEPPLPVGGVDDPPQHGVHGAGEARHLVVGAGLGDGRRSAGPGDLLDPAPDVLHRAQRAPDRPPHDAGQDGAADRDRDEQRTTEDLGALLDVVEVRGDQHGEAVTGRHRVDPHRLAPGHPHGGAYVVGDRTDTEVQPARAVGRGGEDVTVRREDLDREVVEQRVPGGHAPTLLDTSRDGTGHGLEGVVQALGEGASLREHQTEAPRRQHGEHGEGRQQGDPGPHRAGRVTPP